MNDYDFDLKLKSRAKTEIDPVPAGLEDRLRIVTEELPEEQTGVKRARLHILRPALIAAALIIALLVPVCAEVWQGWLEPVVGYGDNGELIEKYTVAVDRTVEGADCTVTLKNLVTDGRAVYCLFSAEFAPDFDFDTALKGAYWRISRPSWMIPGTVEGDSYTFSRVDDRSQKGKAEFIALIYMVQGTTMYYVDEEGGWNRVDVDSLLGQVLTVDLAFRKQKEARYEYYRFEDVQFNDTIELVEVEWDEPDGYLPTRLIVSPLSVYVECVRGPVVEVLPEPKNVPESHFAFGALCEEAFARWRGTDWIKKYEMKLVLADGTHLDLSRLSRAIEGGGGGLSAGSIERKVRVHFGCGFLFPELRRPETVTALIINGVRYEVADAVHQ